MEVSEWSLNVDLNKHLWSGPDSVSLALSDGFLPLKCCKRLRPVLWPSHGDCILLLKSWERVCLLFQSHFLCVNYLLTDACVYMRTKRLLKFRMCSIAHDCGWYVTAKQVFSPCQLPDKIIISHVWFGIKSPLTLALFQNLVTYLIACLIIIIIFF